MGCLLLSIANVTWHSNLSCLKQPAMAPRQVHLLLPDSGVFSAETTNVQFGQKILRAIWRPQVEFCGIVAEFLDKERHELGHLVPVGCPVLQEDPKSVISVCRCRCPKQNLICTVVQHWQMSSLLAVSPAVNVPTWRDSVPGRESYLISFHPNG